MLRGGGAHELAVARAALAEGDALDESSRRELLAALAREAWRREQRLAAEEARPSDARAHELAAWLLARDDELTAWATIARLSDDDASAEAAVLRARRGLAFRELSDRDYARFTAASGAVRARFAALALQVELALTKLAAEERAAADRSGILAFEELPAWTEREHPSRDRVAALTRLDREACARALADAAREGQERDDNGRTALEQLEFASAADVLAFEPRFEAANWRVRRGEHALALEDVDAALRREPGLVEAWTLRARIEDRRGNSRGALVSAERALELAQLAGLAREAELEQIYLGALTRLGLLHEAAIAARGMSDGNPWVDIARALAALAEADDTAPLAETLARWLDGDDDRVKLWAAAALCAVLGQRDERASAVLQTLYDAHGVDGLGGGPLGMTRNDGVEAALWGGLARLASGQRDAAVELWLRDAKGAGEGAVAARGLLATYRDKWGWPPIAALPSFEGEAPIELPDRAAIALRVPGEARDLAAALTALPDGARRIVMGRGEFTAPKEIARAADLVGVGVDTGVLGPVSTLGEVSLRLPALESLRLAELTWRGGVELESGEVIARRVECEGRWTIGAVDEPQRVAAAWFDASVLGSGLDLRTPGARARLDECALFGASWAPPTLNVRGGRIELRRSIARSSPSSALATLEGDSTRVLLEDCRLIGAGSGPLAPVIESESGARAGLVRCRLVDLAPVGPPAVEAEQCVFQRISALDDAPSGWSAHGRAPRPRDVPAREVSVPGDFTTLQLALASAGAGAIIRLGEGVHTVEGPPPHDVELAGAAYDRTVLRAPSGAEALELNGVTVSLRDLTFVSAPTLVTGDGGPPHVAPAREGADDGGELLARLRNATLRLGPSVVLQSPGGRPRFEIGVGGAVVGEAQLGFDGRRVETRTTDDGLLALNDGWGLSCWIDSTAEWRRTGRTPFFPTHRPPLAALRRQIAR